MVGGPVSGHRWNISGSGQWVLVEWLVESVNYQWVLVKCIGINPIYSSIKGLISLLEVGVWWILLMESGEKGEDNKIKKK